MLAENTLLSALEESGREIAQLQAELREVRAALEVAQRDLKIAKDGATALLRRAERAERERPAKLALPYHGCQAAVPLLDADSTVNPMEEIE